MKDLDFWKWVSDRQEEAANEIRSFQIKNGDDNKGMDYYIMKDKVKAYHEIMEEEKRRTKVDKLILSTMCQSLENMCHLRKVLF